MELKPGIRGDSELIGDRSAVQIDEYEPPRAAYFHVPFCARRCGYCNFTLVANRADLIESYLTAIERELSWLKRPREVDSLFFGGGTPTQLRGSQLERLLTLALAWHPTAHGHEFSVEANPADVDLETVRLLARYGVTRISLGAQSFSDDKLRLLERDHRPDDIRRSVALVRDAGMNVALDMIFGAPGESPEAWQADLDAALTLAPDHVSTYGLTFERGTTFWNRLSHGQLIQPGDETQREMFARAIDTLGAAGLEHYEVSNFAKPGQRCRHNEVYWSGGSYFATGPGASRYVNGIRETNHRSTTNYLKRVLSGRSPVAERERLEPEDRARELLVFGLRRMEGVARDWFAAQTGYTLDALVGEPLQRYVSLELLADTGDRVRLTREGLFVSDAIWPDFLRC
jgi:oxygen-independent coproporphyrinogen-3 oxidase